MVATAPGHDNFEALTWGSAMALYLEEVVSDTSELVLLFVFGSY